MISPILSFFLFSCNTTTSTDSGSEKPAVQSCSYEIGGSEPLPGAVNANYRGQIVVTLTGEDDAAYISLEDSSGGSVAGDSSVSESEIHFVPAAPLSPSADYVAKVHYCGSVEPVSINFRTSELGTPLVGGNGSIEGKTFAVDLTSGKIVEPAGVGNFILALLDNTFLIYAQSVTDSEITVVSALSKAASTDQNYCVPSLNDFPAVSISESPYFSLSADSIELTVGEHTAKVYDFSVNGTFASDASEFSGTNLTGEIDAREVYPLINVAGGDEVCGLLDDVPAVSCIECSSDGEPYCLILVLEDLTAVAQNTEIHPVCESNCHELCTENLATCEEPQLQTEVCE